MTRKQALLKVQEILSGIKNNSEIEEMKEKINDIINDLPLMKWTTKTIFDTIEQWVQDNKKLPSSYDISRGKLPPVSVIKNRFGLTYNEFINKYYADKIIEFNSNSSENSVEYWIEVFKSEFKRIKPQSAREYDNKRNKTYPTWKTTARMLKVDKWLELLAYCGLKTYKKTKVYPRKKVCEKIIISRKFDVEEILNKK